MSAFGVSLFRQYRRADDPTTVRCQVVTSSEPVAVELSAEEQRVVLGALYGAILMSQPCLIGLRGADPDDHYTLIAAAKAFEAAVLAGSPVAADLPGVVYEEGSRAELDRRLSTAEEYAS